MHSQLTIWFQFEVLFIIFLYNDFKLIEIYITDFDLGEQQKKENMTRLYN